MTNKLELLKRGTAKDFTTKLAFSPGNTYQFCINLVSKCDIKDEDCVDITIPEPGIYIFQYITLPVGLLLILVVCLCIHLRLRENKF